MADTVDGVLASVGEADERATRRAFRATLRDLSLHDATNRIALELGIQLVCNAAALAGLEALDLARVVASHYQTVAAVHREAGTFGADGAKDA